MKLTKKGVGWLIFGLLVVFSATESDDIPGIASSIALGLVFIALYFMKQRFDPKGTGWFIMGGMLLAFCLDEVLSAVLGFVSKLSILPGDLSDILISLLCAFGCLFMFYRSNKEELHDYADEVGVDIYDFPYQEEVFQETTTVEEVVTPAEEKPVMEIEVTDGSE